MSTLVLPLISFTALFIPFIIQPSHSQVYIGNTTSIEDLPIDHLSSPECKNIHLNDIASSSDKKDEKTDLMTMIDNNGSTYWSNKNIGAWVKLDLGSDRDLCYIEIAWFNGDSRSYNYSLYLSNDNKSYSKKGQEISSGGTKFPEAFDLDHTKARYIQIMLFGNNKNNFAGVAELKVYGRQP